MSSNESSSGAQELALICDSEMGFVWPGRVLSGSAVTNQQEATAPGGCVECVRSAGMSVLGDLCLCSVK